LAKLSRVKLEGELRIWIHAALLLGLAAVTSTALADDARDVSGKKYEFGEDWFTPHRPHWIKNLAPLKGKPGIRYLEIGPYEGRSFFWVLDQILTHPTSGAVAIDIFWAEPNSVYEAGYEHRFRSNLARSGAGDRVEVIKGSSQIEMRKLPLESFDLIYIDGSHAANDVMTDVILAWGLLKPGGLIIFDDYGPWNPKWPNRLRPAFSINSFLSAFEGEVEVVDRYYQLVVRKQANQCLKIGFEGCSRFGAYLYDWRKRNLYNASDLKKVTLTKSETALVEQIVKTKRFGQVGVTISEQLKRDPEFIRLARKLGFYKTLAKPSGVRSY
jgi:SAM-dependent methyltransferase